MDMKMLAKQAGYAYDNQNAIIYGKEQGFYFVAEAGNQSGLLRIEINAQDFERFKETMTELRHDYLMIPAGGIRQKNEYENAIDVNINYFDDGKEFKALIQAIAHRMKEGNLGQQCGNTGLTDRLGIFMVGRSAHILSETGFDQRAVSSKVLSKGQHENPLMGYRGAFIALLLGFLAYIVVSLILPVRLPFLVVIIFFLSVRGFKVRGGEPRKWDIIILLVLSLLGLFISDIVLSTIFVFILLSGGSFLFFWNLFIQGVKLAIMNPLPVIQSYLIPLFFMALYGYYEVRNLIGNASTEKRSKYKYKRLM